MKERLNHDNVWQDKLLSSTERTAAEHGITLTPLRQDYLAALAYSIAYDGNKRFADSANGLYIRRPVKDMFGPLGKVETVARMDFMPRIGEFGAASSPHPEYTTRFVHNGIEGLQNYVLLVETGRLPEPERLAGTTNLRMAHVATRVGFQAYGTPWRDEIIVSATFDEIRGEVFSEEVLRLDELLTRRLAAQSAGRLIAPSGLEE
jgi:hypothetical protein